MKKHVLTIFAILFSIASSSYSQDLTAINDRDSVNHKMPKGKDVEHENYQRFRVAVHSGYSYMIEGVAESMPVDLKKYAKDLLTRI